MRNTDDDFFEQVDEDQDENLGYSPEDEVEKGETKDKKKNSSLFLFLAILFFLVSAGVGAVYFLEQEKAKKELAERHKKVTELEEKVEESENSIETLTNDLNLKDDEIDRLKAERSARIEKIKGLIWKGKQYDILREKIKDLQRVNEELRARIEQLLAEKGTLEEERDQYAGYYDQYLQSEKAKDEYSALIGTLREEVALLKRGQGSGKKGAVSEGLTSSNFECTQPYVQTFRRAKNKTEKEMTKASKVNYIRTKFNLGEIVAKNRTKNLIIGVALKDEKGSIVSNPAKGVTFNVKGQKLGGSSSLKTRYRSPRKQTLNFSLGDGGKKLLKGKYTAVIYISEDSRNYFELCNTSFTLK